MTYVWRHTAHTWALAAIIHDGQVKNKNLIHLISVAAGTFVIYLIAKAENLFWGIRNEMADVEFREIEQFAISDLLLYGLFFLFVLTIQFLIIRPVFNYLIKRDNLTTKNFITIAVILTLFNGLILGLKFGSMELGFIDVLESIGLWLFVFGVFYIIDFMIFKKLTV